MSDSEPGDAGAQQARSANRRARAAWSRLVEPGDTASGWLVEQVGAAAGLAWTRRASAEVLQGRAPVDALGLLTDRIGPLDAAVSRSLARAVTRWATRVDSLDPERDLRAAHLVGAELVVPGDVRWPRGLDDLGARAPHCLWWRGGLSSAAGLERSVAVVGARASSPYGDHVAGEIVAGLVDRGFVVVSGGAYGIDAAAHRATLAAGGVGLAFLAGGVDRPYPAGNAALLAALREHGGAVVSEVPPGAVPSRSRFLQRNRLIAAAASATVVVEAGWRSGAISSATHAAELGRPIGAVPGPVTSAASAGCHRLLRDGKAVCVTDAAEVAEIAGRLGADSTGEEERDAAHRRVGDAVDAAARLVLDALPARAPRGLDDVVRAAGLPRGEVLGALGVLELGGLVASVGTRWRRAI